MSFYSGHQMPLTVKMRRKTEMRTQFAALCYRIRRDKPEILLITSRGSKRWILPKGWPKPGLTPARGALSEAWEEAGVKGRAIETCLGVYSYYKVEDPGDKWPCIALVYPVRVKKLSDEFPESGQRRLKWASPKKAAKLVDEPELREILRNFDPRRLRL